ncbi:MAG: DUF4105 domain-containing protein [Bacteroidia bacterium]|nr:DUF4105 domain-containing protein [Bacteroidia bacterium]
MRKIFSFILILTTCINLIHAAGEKLSPLAEVSIITCSPGEELYSVFGHSAVRVVDPINNIDYIYNYGTFDFDTPNFYLKFARGKLDYMLSVELFKNFKENYISENRSVWEQVLDLSSSEKQRVFDLLEENARPENKYYKYDFFYDNCSTRIRDILQKALNNSIVFPDLKGKNKNSFRDLIEPYLKHHIWSDFGIDLALGLPTDKIAASAQYMFLPYELKKGFDDAKIKNPEKKLVKITNTIYETKVQNVDTTMTVTPNMVFWSLFFVVAIISALIWKRNPKRYWFDFLIFLIFGLLGIFLLLLWFATDHKATAWNFNLLWALPFHAVMAFLLLKKNKPNFLNYYFLVTSLLTLLLLISYKALPQWLNISTIPILLILCFRAFVIFWKENRD